MAQKNYTVHITVISGFFIGVALFSYLLVDHHLGMPNQVKQAQAGLLSNGQSVGDRIKPVGKVDMELPATSVLPVAAVTAAMPMKDGAQVYNQSCVACHGTGIAGAPKFGDQAQWKSRLAKGVNSLYLNALNGVQSPAGVMPAKGGNAALSETEVKAAVDFIVAKLK